VCLELKRAHPKNEKFVIIFLPSSCSKPLWVSFFCWTQKIIWRMLVTRQLLDPIDFHCRKVSGCCQLSGYQQSSKYLLLCSTKERDSNDTIFILGWTIPLTLCLKDTVNCFVHFNEQIWSVQGDQLCLFAIPEVKSVFWNKETVWSFRFMNWRDT